MSWIAILMLILMGCNINVQRERLLCAVALLRSAEFRFGSCAAIEQLPDRRSDSLINKYKSGL